MAQSIKVLVLDYIGMENFYNKFRNKREYSFEITTSLHKCFIYLATQNPDIMLLPFISKETQPEHDILTIAKTNGIPFIVVDREATQDKVIQSVRIGAMDYVVTSIDELDFIKKINKVLIKKGKIPPSREEVQDIGFEEGLTGIEKIITVLDKAKEVKAMPYTVAKVISLCSSPDSSASDVIKPIKSDAALGSSILKHSNSTTYYRGAPKITSLKDAIVRIGLEKTKETCMVHAVYKLFDKNDKTFGFNRYQFWVHSLATGIIAKWLAKKFHYERLDEAVLGGVLHDLGKMILDDYFTTTYDKIIRMAATQKKILSNVESKILETDHSFIGGRIAKNWNFPEKITYAIKNHHDYARCFPDGGQSINLATIIFVSNYLAKAMGLGTGGDFFVTPVPHILWAKLGFDTKIPEDFLQTVRKEIQYYYHYLKIPQNTSSERQDSVNKKMRVLILSNSRIPNVYVRVYLANHGIDFSVGGVGVVPESDYDLIIYDFIEELHPDEMEFMIKTAEDYKNTSAIFIHGGVNDILVIQKIHKSEKRLSAPLDMFAFDQLIKNYDPKTKAFSDSDPENTTQ